MIQSLSIKHYALIDSLEIAFDDGLNIITGETGSGKSILLGALGLILGDRAEIAAVQKGEKKCVVEGTFKLDASEFAPQFEALDLDFEELTIIRREILANGKSRAFVNDTPVKLTSLKEIGRSLVDIHSQHQTIEINNSDFQLAVLDSYADTGKLLKAYHQEYATYQNISSELEEAQNQFHQAVKEQDYQRFQLEELNEVGLDAWQGQNIDDEYAQLSNAEEIQQKLAAGIDALNGIDQSALALAKLAKDRLADLRDYSTVYSELFTRLDSATIELDDITQEMENLAEDLSQDPERLMALDAIKSKLFSLERKHGVEGVDALISLRDTLGQQLLSTDELEVKIDSLQAAKEEALHSVLIKGEKLSLARKKKTALFCKEIEKVLKNLNIKHAKFDVEITPLSQPSINGLDGVTMLFSANLGQDVQPIQKVASGGELSRVLLAIKELSARKSGRLSMVFDEIDTGVSGEVAHAMGEIMKDMSGKSQIICITHLPQIASKGKAHFKVFKKDASGTNQTSILRLEGEERIVEIAQLLSGANTTEAALANARELLHLN